MLHDLVTPFFFRFPFSDRHFRRKSWYECAKILIPHPLTIGLEEAIERRDFRKKVRLEDWTKAYRPRYRWKANELSFPTVSLRFSRRRYSDRISERRKHVQSVNANALTNR